MSFRPTAESFTPKQGQYLAFIYSLLSIANLATCSQFHLAPNNGWASAKVLRGKRLLHIESSLHRRVFIVFIPFRGF